MKLKCVAWCIVFGVLSIGASVRLARCANINDAHLSAPARIDDTDTSPLNIEDANAILLLKDLTDFAQINNPLLKSDFFRYEGFKERAPQASTLPDPEFSYGYFINPIETRNGPQEYKFRLSQQFPLGGKLKLKEDLANKEAREAFHKYTLSRLKITAEISTTFYEYAYLHAAISVKEEHLQLLKAMESVAGIRFQAGKVDQSALIQIQIEQGKIEDEISELIALRPSLSSNILVAIGDDNTRTLPWPSPVESNSPELGIEELRLKMIKFNPSLAIARLRTEEREISFTLAQKVTIPDLTIGLEQYEIGGGSDATAATVSINLPLWRKRTRAARNEAHKNLQSAGTMTLETKNRLLSKLDMVFYYYNDGRRKVSLYTKTLIPKAKQAIDVALRGFQTGSVGFLDLLNAQRTLLEFQLIAKRQETNVMKRLAELEALVGSDCQSVEDVPLGD